MRAMTILVNGNKVATIGFGDDGVLISMVYWSGSTPRGRRCHLSLHGLDSSAGETGEHLFWESGIPKLKVGDEVTIRLEELPADQIDPPSSRQPVKRDKQGRAVG